MDLKSGSIDNCTNLIKEAIQYSEISETDLNTFFQMMKLQVEGLIQEHEIQTMVSEEENEDAGPQKSPEGVRQMIYAKTKSFLGMVDEIRDRAFTQAMEIWKSKSEKKEELEVV